MKITRRFTLRKREGGYRYLNAETKGKRQSIPSKSTGKSEALEFVKNYSKADTLTESELRLSQSSNELPNGTATWANTLGSYVMAVKRLISLCGNNEVGQFKPEDLEKFKVHQIRW